MQQRLPPGRKASEEKPASRVQGNVYVLRRYIIRRRSLTFSSPHENTLRVVGRRLPEVLLKAQGLGKERTLHTPPGSARALAWCWTKGEGGGGGQVSGHS